jgi:hypothetical protein
MVVIVYLMQMLGQIVVEPETPEEKWLPKTVPIGGQKPKNTYARSSGPYRHAQIDITYMLSLYVDVTSVGIPKTLLQQ